MTLLLEAVGVTKVFGSTPALEHLDIEARCGEPLAILGRNGAGKTTLINLLSTLQRPDSGRLSVLGVDTAERARDVRRLIGLAGQYAAVEPLMTGRENLEVVASLFGLGRLRARARSEEVLELLGLSDVADRRVGTYSGGLRRRLDLGAGLVGFPQVLLLDEPTTGLDPASRRGLWHLVGSLGREGVNVVLTTQYLEEAEDLAQRVVVLEKGRVVADGTVNELTARYARARLSARFNTADAVQAVVDDLAQVGFTADDVDPATGEAAWSSPDPATLTSALFTCTSARGLVPQELSLRRPTLEDAFLAITTDGGLVSKARP